MLFVGGGNSRNRSIHLGWWNPTLVLLCRAEVFSWLCEISGGGVTYVVELVTEDVDGFAVVGDDVETGVVVLVTS